MGTINFFGIAVVASVLLPNIIFAMRCRDGFENLWKNKLVETVEQIGRFGCFAFMMINVPKTWFGFFSEDAKIAYYVADGVLVLTYLAIWAICFKKSSVFRAIALSAIPSAMFLISGILLRSVLLTVAAAIFSPSHITLSYKNAVAQKNTEASGATKL